MARYAIGDIQGCLTPLRDLLQQVRFDPDTDELWLVGDLVNRGPDSAGVLRFLFPQRDSIRLVLGNHDLHLLALAHGVGDPAKDPDLQAVLDAAEAQDWLNWLSESPLVYRDRPGGWMMVHAGLAPSWSSDKALALSREVEACIRGPQAAGFYQAMYGNSPAAWSDQLQGMDRLRTITNFCTRLRYLHADGGMDFHCKVSLGAQPKALSAWFDAAAVPRRESLLFGHWAALEGLLDRRSPVGLDTGCVWGKHLTLMNLDTRELAHCDYHA